MGEIAEATINGFYCQQCGCYIDGEEPGYTRYCEDCEEENNYCRKKYKRRKLRNRYERKNIICNISDYRINFND